MSANKKIQFQIHEVNETGYEYNEQLSPIADEQFQIRIGLRFEAKDNYFTMEAKVLCLNNKDVFLTYSAEWVFVFKNINEAFILGDSITDKAGIMPTLADVAVNGIRGMLALKTKDLPLGSIVLPYVQGVNLLEKAIV